MSGTKSLDFVISSIAIGQRKLIENLSFQLCPGSIQLLKAPNGTGKSVLLSVLAGYDESIDGIEVSATCSNGIESFRIPKDLKRYRKYARGRIGYLSHRLFEESFAVKFGEEISFITQKYTTIPDEISKYNQYYAGSGGIYGSVQAGKLNPEAFPPCIKTTVEGVSSGGRNDAIVLLLTSFASYARLYPRIFASDETVKVSDMDPDLSITENEILPLIFDAADNCTPPLFDDQPQEKINIISKLGFGMHETVDINHEGETKWYTPMSCEKIKIHLPNLCHPDKSCKGINNPLSCYGRKKFQLDKQQKEEK